LDTIVLWGIVQLAVKLYPFDVFVKFVVQLGCCLDAAPAISFHASGVTQLFDFIVVEPVGPPVIEVVFSQRPILTGGACATKALVLIAANMHAILKRIRLPRTRFELLSTQR
jgi:hypothetical protein